MSSRREYESPLAARYASREMNEVWSPQRKFSTWRRLWLYLARAEKELGLAIPDEALAQMEAHLEDIDFAAAEAKERELRHDVMAHIHAFGQQCPAARPILHLGATSCYVTDNGDLIQMREGLRILRGKLVAVMERLRGFADRYKALPTLGFTHFQPAQLTTVGKRACLWLNDFLMDFRELDRLVEEIPFRGVKGTTGTQASFLELFDGDHARVEALDARVTEMAGFRRAVPVCGQTYSRKVDYRVLSVLSGVAQSAAKMCTDLRLLAHLKEIEEPFGKGQVGSSAMAYKRNPMRCERVCSLARYVSSLPANAAQTQAGQWLERTLDDSANRRLVLPEAFLATDILLSTVADIAGGLVVWPQVIERHVREELPFMATEAILMACVRAGADRQNIHEAIRRHALEASRRVKEEGAPNDLLDRLRADPLFAPVHGQLDRLLDPVRFIGRCPQQVEAFLAGEVDPILAQWAGKAGAVDAVTV